MPASATQGGHNKCSAEAEMGDRLATLDVGRELVAVPLMGEARSSCNTMWPGTRPILVPGGILIHTAVWPQQTWAENWRPCPLGVDLGPHQTQCCPG